MMNFQRINEILILSDDPSFSWIFFIVFFYFARRNKLTEVQTATLGILLCIFIKFYLYSLNAKS